MGCVNSKQIKSPSKGASWGKAVRRGFTIQVDRSIKTTDGGYLAAIFSANYGIVANRTPVKALEKPESLPKLSGEGSYAKNKASVVPEIQSNKHVSEKSCGHTEPDVSIVTTDHESWVHTAQRPKLESANENSDTINVLELMEGLAEAEVSANIDQWHANHEASMSLTPVAERHEKPAANAYTQRRSGKSRARRPRPRSFSSFKSVEDVDRALSARRSGYLPPIRSSRKAEPANEQGKVSSKGSSCSSNALYDGKAFQNRDNLRRALSFKYMLSDDSSKKLDCLISDLNPLDSQIDEVDVRLLCRERLVVATSRLRGEGEGVSTLSSPAFSPAISFKDWLPSINHSSNFPYPEHDLEHYVFNAVQSCQPYRPTLPHHSTDNLKARIMYSQVVASPSPSLQYQEGHAHMSTRVEKGNANMSARVKEGIAHMSTAARVSTRVEEGTVHISTRVEEDYAFPVFDPEMLDSFEKAMQNLSKEEWDALRGMEDSPRNFLRLVKALKKSSSSSMRNLKAFGTDASECAESLDIKLKRLSVEKKLAHIRQSSLEVKKALAKQLSLKQGRANVVFYSSTTRANPKMFEDCNQVRSILQSLGGVSYDERSVSEMLEHEQELSYALNISSAIVPTILVKGKYLVGIESIMQLYKKGLLNSMLQEAASFGSKTTSMQCICRGTKFLNCPFCKGRSKLRRVGEGAVLCRYCSSTGLIKCISCLPT